MRARCKNSKAMTKINFISTIKSTLITARDEPETGLSLGVSWITPSQFVVNSKTLADQWQITANDLCYNFRSHDFTTESTKRCRDAIKSLGTPKNCRLHTYEGLTQMTIETALDGNHWKKPKPIPGRKSARKLNLQMPQQTETALKLDHPDMIEKEVSGPDGTNSTVTNTTTCINSLGCFWDEFDLVPVHEDRWDELDLLPAPEDKHDLVLVHEDHQDELYPVSVGRSFSDF
jgi:hypothetical protein